MIHHSELRIGNRIEYRGNHPSFDGTFNLAFAKHIIEADEWHLLDPILMSHEILLEWGFEILDEEADLMRYGIPKKFVSIYNYGGTLRRKEKPYYFNYEDGFDQVEIKSLHQLQNLVFALIGK